MASETFYPYQTAPSAVTLELGPLSEPLVLRDDGAVDAYTTLFDVAVVPITVTVDVSELAGLLPDGAQLDDAVEVVVVRRGIEAVSATGCG